MSDYLRAKGTTVQGSTPRRSFLKASALFGAGAFASRALIPAAGVAKGMPAATSGGPVPSPAPANLLKSLFEAGGSRCDARHNTPL
jgi:hypothetical protein